MINDLSPLSKVWMYLSARPFNDAEVFQLNKELKQFCIQWSAHGSELKAHGEVLHHRFIVLLVDESRAGASGCSIDQSVHFLQGIEKKYNTELFNRMLVAIKLNETVQVLHLNEFKNLVREGKFNEDSLVFNTLVQTKAVLDTNFVIPVKESWLARYTKASV